MGPSYMVPALTCMAVAIATPKVTRQVLDVLVPAIWPQFVTMAMQAVALLLGTKHAKKTG